MMLLIYILAVLVPVVLLNDRYKGAFLVILLWAYALQNLTRAEFGDYLFISQIIVAVSFLVVYYKGKKYSIRFTTIDIAAAAYMLISLLFVFGFAVYSKGEILLAKPVVTGHGSFKLALMGFFYETRFIFAYFIIRFVARQNKEIELIRNTIIAVIISVAVFGVIQYFTPLWDMMLPLAPGYSRWEMPFKKIYSFLLNFWDVAIVMAIGFAIQFQKLIEQGPENFKKNIILLVIIVSAALLTYTRSSWLICILFALGFMTLIVFLRRRVSLFMLKLILASVLGFAVVSIYSNNSVIIKWAGTIVTMSDSMGSAQGHIDGIKSGLALIKIHPLGVGTGVVSFARRFESDAYFIPESWIMQVFIELGVIGGLIFLSMMLVVIIKSFKISLYEAKNRTPLFYESAMLCSLTAALLIISFIAQHVFLGNITSAYYWIVVALWVNKYQNINNCRVKTDVINIT